VIVMTVLAYAHWLAFGRFPSETVMVHKLTGTVMQVVGGLTVLHSVDSNLGLFRKKNLAATVIAWLRECPIVLRTVTASGSATLSVSASASASAAVLREVTTVEERLAELERRMDEFRSEVAGQHRAIRSSIEEVKSELSTSILANQSQLHSMYQKVEKATVGGFKQQAFGVMLVIYGAVTSVFA